MADEKEENVIGKGLFGSKDVSDGERYLVVNMRLTAMRLGHVGEDEVRKIVEDIRGLYWKHVSVKRTSMLDMISEQIIKKLMEDDPNMTEEEKENVRNVIQKRAGGKLGGGVKAIAIGPDGEAAMIDGPELNEDAETVTRIDLVGMYDELEVLYGRRSPEYYAMCTYILTTIVDKEEHVRVMGSLNEKIGELKAPIGHTAGIINALDVQTKIEQTRCTKEQCMECKHIQDCRLGKIMLGLPVDGFEEPPPDENDEMEDVNKKW